MTQNTSDSDRRDPRRPSDRISSRADTDHAAVRDRPGVLLPTADPARAHRVALALAIGMTPIAAHGHDPPTEPLAVVGLMLEGLLVGFAFAFAIATVFAAVQGAGVLADSCLRLLVWRDRRSDQRKPRRRADQPLRVGGIAAVPGDWRGRVDAAGLRRRSAIPLTGGPQLTRWSPGRCELAAVLIGAIEVVAPVARVVITDIAFGMVAEGRTAAQRVRGRLPGEGRGRAACRDRRRSRSWAGG